MELYGGLPANEIFRLYRIRRNSENLVVDTEACEAAFLEARKKSPAVEQQLVDMLMELTDESDDRVSKAAMKVLSGLTKALLVRNKIRKLHDAIMGA